MKAKLCYVCQTFLETWCKKLASSAESDFHRSTPYRGTKADIVLFLESSGQNGCPWCDTFSAQFERGVAELQYDEEMMTGDARGAEMWIVYLGPSLPWEINLAIPSDETLGFQRVPGFGVGTREIAKLELFASETDNTFALESSTDSSLALSLVRFWIDGCKSSHQACHSITKEVPTRLIHLNSKTSRVVETLVLTEAITYLTLSHCWGDLKLLKLTRHNIENLKLNVPEEELCKTFSDAFKIIRALGFAYIWIDSLCIIQDDEDDWREEASKMSTVYGCSTLNLAASHGPDGSYGCFIDRDEDDLRRLRRRQIQIPFTDPPVRLDCLDPTTFRRSIEQSPLADRGWAFQERFLAARTLHFTKTQLYWECREFMACESFQDRLPDSQYHTTIEKQDPHLIWPNVVEHYSQSKLTKQDDKLVAISGVARWLNSKIKDRYVVGMWEKNLILQLQWRPHPEYNEGFQRVANRLPSWSWASYHGKIHMETHVKGYTPLSSIVEIKIVPAGHDVYGEISFAILRLEILPLIDASKSSVVAKLALQTVFPDDQETLRKASWFYLPLLERQFDERVIRGLIIEPVTGNDIRGQFCRVGVFYAFKRNSSDGKNSDYEVFLQVMQDLECHARQDLYEGAANIDAHERQTYSITLV